MAAAGAAEAGAARVASGDVTTDYPDVRHFSIIRARRSIYCIHCMIYLLYTVLYTGCGIIIMIDLRDCASNPA